MSPTASSVDPLDRVTVVVVTYHSAHCLPALDALLSVCPHVIVSDNGSEDDTVAQAQQHWPHAQVLAHGRNLGFGAANNRALEQVSTPFALLLNPDCDISADGVRQLIEAADVLPDAALVAPQLCNAARVPDVNYRWPSPCWTSRGPAADGPACVGFVVGAAWLLRLSRFDGVGFFDERFFLYYEDDDLCLRLFQHRRPMVIWPAVQAIHRSRGSVRGRRPWQAEYLRGYHHAQSKLTFLAKHRCRDLARRRRWQLLAVTSLALPLRAVLWSPRLLARMAGRWAGLWQWRQRDD